jgi:putative two-component system response regulator
VAAEIALTHHEKYDGSGYPSGLSGSHIPLVGRICGLSDVFDALTSVRPYKQAWPADKAIAEINAQAGRHFDPALVIAFNEVLPELLRVKRKVPDEKPRARAMPAQPPRAKRQARG